MGIKLQGIAAKLGKLQHDAEFEAAKLDARVEEAAARLPAVFSGAHKTIDGLEKDVGDVEAVLNAVESVSNGAPPLDDELAAQSASLNGTGQPIEQGIGPTHIMPVNP